MNFIYDYTALLLGKTGADLTTALSNIQGVGKQAFIQNIQNDMITAQSIAQRGGLEFTDPYKAVYHFYKHGSDFPNKITGNTLNFYLGNVPDKIIRDANLIDVTKFQVCFFLGVRLYILERDFTFSVY